MAQTTLFLATVVCIVAFIVWYLSTKRRRRLLRERSTYNLDAFRTELGITAYSDIVISAVYEDVFDLSGIPPRPNDRLQNDLNIIPGDFEVRVEHRCKELRLTGSDIPALKNFRIIKTVKDYLEFLSLAYDSRNGLPR